MKTKILYALLSIVLAFGLWAYVITVESPGSTEMYYDIPLTWVGESVLEEERNLVVTSISSTNVDMTLSGNRSDLSNVNSGNITLKADLAKIYEPGQHKIEYSISFPGNVPANAFTVESQNPKYITINVERRVSKPVPVNVVYSGNLSDKGYMFDKQSAVLDHTEVTISGPESVVNQITQAVLNVDLSGRSESISESYRYTLCDEEGKPVDAKSIRVNVEEVRLDLKIEYVKEIQLVCTVINGGGATAETARIDIMPRTIRVSGSKAALDGMGDTINLGTIHLADIATAAVKKYAIILPDGVTNQTGYSEASVAISFPGMAKRTFTIEDIRLENLPEGMNAELITQSLVITVRGPGEEITKLTAEDIYILIDLTDAAEGTSTYKPIVIFSDGFPTVGAVKVDSITVDVSAEPGK